MKWIPYIALFIGIFGCRPAAWVGWKIAEIHYKFFKTDQPLYVIYGGGFVLLWILILFISVIYFFDPLLNN